MQPIAIDIVRGRKRPSHPEYLQSDCPMLSFISALGATVHGFSTTMMLSMFNWEFVAAKLPPDELSRLVCFIYTGTPVHRSTFYGLGGMQPVVSESTQMEIGPYIDEIVDGSVNISSAWWNIEPFMNGFEVFDETELDTLVSPPPVEVCELELSGTDVVADCRKARRCDRVPWTAVEDAFVLEFYNLHGGHWRRMAREMVGATKCARSDDALRNRHSRLTSLTSDGASSTSSSSSDSHPFRLPCVRVPWTTAEDALIVAALVKCHGRVTWTHIARALPGRTPHAIRNRAHRLEMTK